MSMTAPELKATLKGLFGRSWRRMATRPPPSGLGISVSTLNRYTARKDPLAIPGPVEACVAAWMKLEARLEPERARTRRARARRMGDDH